MTTLIMIKLKMIKYISYKQSLNKYNKYFINLFK